ncbi:MAG: ABC transporter substrate-binding protein, partial [Lachnospiraceae bacterium]
MKKRWMALFLAVALTSASFAGCAGNKSEDTAKETKKETVSDKESVIVTMPASSEPESGFDPAYGWGAGEHVHEPLIQSTLLTTTEDLEIEKDLATDYSVSEDGLTWTVQIRDDVKFTDGEKLTAKDVAFTYNNCVKNSTVNDFTMLEKAVAVDDTTVEFQMNKPFSIWPYTMAIVGIVPEHAYDENY